MYQKYIILSTPRTGSNYLAYLLASHPNIVSFGEPFQPQFLLGNPVATLFEHPFIFATYKLLRDSVPVFFVNHLIFTSYPPHIRAVGFKIFYEHAHKGNLVSVWSFLRDMPDLKIIHLKRRNILKSYVSRLIAERTGEYLRFHANQPQASITLTLTSTQCEAYFRGIERDRKTYKQYFKNHPIHTVWYEDFISQTTEQLQTIQNFLGVPVAPLISPLVKQNTRPLKEIIRNYEQIRKAFEKTRWTSFFNETNP